MQELMRTVKKVQDTLPDEVATSFAKSREEGTHCVEIFVTTPVDNAVVYEKVLLGILLMENKISFDAGKHHNYTKSNLRDLESHAAMW